MVAYCCYHDYVGVASVKGAGSKINYNFYLSTT